MAMVTIKRERRPTRHVLRCDCCGCLSRPAATQYLAARWAHMGKWDTPGPDCENCGFDRCPMCVDLNRWPPETQGWKEFGTPGDGPTIRLADGDQAADVVLGEMPEALIAEA